MIVTKLCLDASEYRKELARVVDETRSAAREIADAAQDKTVNVAAVVSGKDGVDAVAQAVDALPDVKTVNVAVQTSGAGAIADVSGNLANAGKSALSFKSVVQTVVQTVGNAFGTLGNIISKAFSGPLGWISAAVTAAVAGVKLLIDWIQASQEKALEAANEAVEGAEKATKQFDAASASLKECFNILKEFNDEVGSSAGKAAGLQSAMLDLAENFEYVGIEIDKATGKILNFEEASKRLNDKTKKGREEKLKEEMEAAERKMFVQSDAASIFGQGIGRYAISSKLEKGEFDKLRKYAAGLRRMSDEDFKVVGEAIDDFLDKREKYETYKATGFETEEERDAAAKQMRTEQLATTQEANRIAKEDEEIGNRKEFERMSRGDQKRELQKRIEEDDKEIAELERRRNEAKEAEAASDDPLERAKQGKAQADATLEIERAKARRNERKRNLDAMNAADLDNASARRDAARQSADAAETALQRQSETPEERKQRLQKEIEEQASIQKTETGTLAALDPLERAKAEERIAKAKEAQAKAQMELNALEKEEEEKRKAAEKEEKDREQRLSDWKNGQLSEAQSEAAPWLTRDERRAEHMARAVKEATDAKGAPLTADEEENTRKIADLTFAIRESANAFTPGQLQVMTNDLTSRGGFQTGGRVSDVNSFNENVKNQMAAIKELLQSMRDVAVAQEQRSRPGGSSTWPY